MVSAKRKRGQDADEDATPRKTRVQVLEGAHDSDAQFAAQTPSRKGRGLLPENGTPKSILKKTSLFDGTNGNTPKSNRRLVFQTPSKSAQDEAEDSNTTPTIVRSVDRSARRKSNRKLIERTLNGVDDDEEALDEEEILAEQILSDGENEEQAQELSVPEALPEPDPVPDTPSKRKRGRPKGTGKNQIAKRKQEEEQAKFPPSAAGLPPHEEYFWQNRPGGTKTSNNTLPVRSLLNHDEYFKAKESFQDRHQPEKDFLLELHSRAYDQWLFELQEGFNLCLYGYGSKLPITSAFTSRVYRHLLDQPPYKGTKSTPKIVVVNGYDPRTTLKQVLTTIASTITPPKHTAKPPNQPPALTQYILDNLTRAPPPHPLLLVINSIDGPNLRKAPTPALLASLAAHPSINLVCTADTPSFPLLWDVGLKAQYRFLFHDTTTFAAYDEEIDVVDTVNELLGRKGRRVGGADGVGFVLRSLPENARSLFRILIAEQLALAYADDNGDTTNVNNNQDDYYHPDEDIDDEDPSTTTTPRSKSKSKSKSKKAPDASSSLPSSSQGVEFRVLYRLAVEQFVCSGEVGFRTLLKEFHDHQMVESRKDALGTERLWAPFSTEEMEGLLEELSGEGGGW